MAIVSFLATLLYPLGNGCSLCDGRAPAAEAMLETIFEFSDFNGMPLAAFGFFSICGFERDGEGSAGLVDLMPMSFSLDGMALLIEKFDPSFAVFGSFDLVKANGMFATSLISPASLKIFESLCFPCAGIIVGFADAKGSGVGYGKFVGGGSVSLEALSMRTNFLFAGVDCVEVLGDDCGASTGIVALEAFVDFCRVVVDLAGASTVSPITSATTFLGRPLFLVTVSADMTIDFRPCD
jgi:hypothetical protein